MKDLKVGVDQELCISCGTCVDLCPEVFQWNDDDKASAVTHDVPAELEDQANEAIENCPTNAIAEQ